MVNESESRSTSSAFFAFRGEDGRKNITNDISIKVSTMMKTRHQCDGWSSADVRRYSADVLRDKYYMVYGKETVQAKCP